MRIVVVDDILDFGNVVARALDGTPHEVTAVLSPEALPGVLGAQGFDLALVDMDFYYAGSRQTGLTALRHLTEHAVRAIIYSLDSEDNRLLFLFAAFQFYDPLTLLSKGEGSQKIRHLIDLVDQGTDLGPDPEADRYRPPEDRVPVLDRLIRKPADLDIWVALSRFPGRREVAYAAHVSARTIDEFLADRYPVVQEIRMLQPGRDQDATGIAAGATGAAGHHGGKKEKRELLGPLHAFAVTHQHFFGDPEVRALIEARQRSPHRLPGMSAAVPAGRGRNHR
jgi:CheY-like chemotaxis protein